MSRSRQVTDFPRSEAGLVDRFLGTAYDVVRNVYINLDIIRNINDFIVTGKVVVSVKSKEDLYKLPKFFFGQANVIAPNDKGFLIKETYYSTFNKVTNKREWHKVVTREGMAATLPYNTWIYEPLKGYDTTGQNAKDPYYFSAFEESEYSINGRVGSEDLSAKAPYVGKANIVFADNKVSISRFASVYVTGVSATLPIHDVVGYCFNKGNVTTPFVTKDSFDVGFNTIKYIGKEPLHTNLMGNIEFAIRVANDNNNDRRLKGGREIRSPETSIIINRKVMKEPNAYRTYGLVRSFNRINLPVVKLESFITEGASSLSEEEWFELLNSNPEGFDELTFLDVNGYISANSVKTDLVYHEDAYTTEWISTAGFTKLLINRTDTSPYRIQYKDYAGNIHIDSSVSNIAVEGDKKIWFIPPNAMQFRIFYKNSSYPNSILNIWGINKKFDAFFGSWITYSLNFNRPFTFIPEEEYEFKVVINRTYGLPTKFEVGDVILVNGDLSFDYNITNIIKGKGEFK